MKDSEEKIFLSETQTCFRNNKHIIEKVIAKETTKPSLQTSKRRLVQ